MNKYQIWVHALLEQPEQPNEDGPASTPYSRMKRVWHTIHPFAMVDESAIKFQIASNGHDLQIIEGHLQRSINLKTWASEASLLIGKFNSAVDGLLPFGLAIDSSFSAERIDDHDVRMAPHMQPHNKIWMDPICAEVESRLLDPLEKRHRLCPLGLGKPDKRAACKWLALDQQVLSLLATIFSLTCGMPLRAWQFASLFFNHTPEHLRNIWVLPGGIVIVANPFSKQRNRLFAPTLFAFPLGISTHLLYYLLILRPIACTFFQSLGEHVEVYRNEIWARPMCRRNRVVEPYRWTGNDIGNAIKRCTKPLIGVALTPAVIRQIMQAVFRHKFPRLFELYFSKNASESIAGLSQDGLRCIPTLCMPGEQGGKLLAVSQIWQAAIGIGPFDEAWRDVTLNSHILPTIENVAYAREQAMGTINRYFNVGTGNRHNKQRVAVLLSDFHFLTSSEVFILFCSNDLMLT